MNLFEIPNPLTGNAIAIRRVIGQYSQGRPGPLLVVLTGIHGNEPSGVLGLAAVLEKLQAEDPPFFGRMVGIAGNLGALEVNQRFLDEDLNRIWLPERVKALREGREPHTREEADLRTILDVIDDHRHPQHDNYFLDCHTTSSESVPYISVPVDARSVEWAGEFPVHTVIGGGDELVGVSDRYLIDQGFCGFTFEAGQHGRLSSIEAQEAAIWVALHRAGCLADPPHRAEQFLMRTQIDGHKYYEFEYVHTITPESGFRMRPGYVNFQRISKGDLLAWEREKPILSQWDARVFLPLYQAQGDDGFSIIREADFANRTPSDPSNSTTPV
ncbi:MAG: succinylglutamate desuccinylase/aspartoacylase family protein [Planctomycetaceae bacterium]|nr:succinylglutamate desuccinylase/aspartoacylase family protein [Planctomycetaceae bacterium]